MQDIRTIKRDAEDFPSLLREINDPPKELYIRGNISPLLNPSAKILCVVGARQYSDYGKEVTEKLIAGLKGYNICIVSGLALGIDSMAHRSALKAGLYTVAFPGSGLDPSVIYPATHSNLAEEIVESGGALVSEFNLLQKSAPWTFPSRNRLMAGISHATLVIEAELKSGTLITSKNATEYNRDVGAVPGNIYSPLSAGPHMLIRLGATPVTCVDDLLELLGFARRGGQSKLSLSDNSRFTTLGEIDQKVVKFLEKGQKSKDDLVRELNLDPKIINMTLSSLELEGFIKEEEDGIVRVV
jgi:DNA processing protein